MPATIRDARSQPTVGGGSLSSTIESPNRERGAHALAVVLREVADDVVVPRRHVLDRERAAIAGFEVRAPRLADVVVLTDLVTPARDRRRWIPRIVDGELVDGGIGFEHDRFVVHRAGIRHHEPAV